MVRKKIALLLVLFACASAAKAKVLLKFSGGRARMKTVTKKGFMSSASKTFRDESDRFVAMNDAYGKCFLDIQVPGEKEPVDLIIPGVDPQDFQIGEGQRGGTYSQTTTINGKTTSSTSYIWSYQLTPKKPGEYLIGPVEGSYNGLMQSSNALKLTVYPPEEYRRIAGIAESISDFTARVECAKDRVVPGEKINLAIVVEYVGADRLRCRFPSIKGDGLFVLGNARDEERIMIDGKQGWRFTQHYTLMANHVGSYKFSGLSVVGRFSHMNDRKRFTGDEVRAPIGDIAFTIDEPTEETAANACYRTRLYWDKDEITAKGEAFLFFEMESDDEEARVEPAEPNFSGGHLIFQDEQSEWGEEGDPFAWKVVHRYLFRPSREGSYTAYDAQGVFLPPHPAEPAKSDVFSFENFDAWKNNSFFNPNKPTRLEVPITAGIATLAVGKEADYLMYLLGGIIVLLLLIIVLGSFFIMRQQKGRKR